MVSTPPGTDVVSLDPSYLEVTLERRVSRTVDIAAQTSGQLRQAYELGDLQVDPSTVEVSGPRSAVTPLQSVPTEPIDLDGRTETFQTQVRLRPIDPSVTYQNSGRITVRVPIRAETIRRQFDDLPVEIVNTTRPTSLSQSTVDLTVEGPRELVNELEANTLHGSIDMSGVSDKPAGTYEKEIQVRNLPDGVSAIQVNPTHFLVRVAPAETPSP
jgi:YbbR domain-containing protein